MWRQAEGDHACGKLPAGHMQHDALIQRALLPHEFF